MANHIERTGILYSCYQQKSSEGEQFIPNHTFGYIISGSSEIFIGGKKHVFKEGDFRFFRRNQLAKYTKYPSANGEYKSVSIILDQENLKAVSAEYRLQMEHPDNTIFGLGLEPKKLLVNYMDSIKPYLEKDSTLNQALVTLKVKEAILILLQTNPELKDVLFDFTEPGKIDLEAYMNEHYKFNVDISRFAYLTGRSLATFKRDFEKIFNTSPNRWIQQKRLADAHYLLKEKGWRTADVYMEVGFKDFSHFSFAFKKAYGIAPSKLTA
ncbi:AraC family transcriptional regulator [Pedobacter aquatilis]|uniref:AraC family transcriptional regulator n=1 Tax=Pedobacter aquatilis TaxID=351343 RepID=UPI00292EE1F0|nr:AraC family transcriptional regulator [Pedobacter aquatilis]